MSDATDNTDISLAAPDAESDKARAAASRSLMSGTARIATATGVRQILTMSALAVTAAVVARCLGPRSFGEYAGGTAAFNLTYGLTDLGFSILLLRELGRSSEDEQGRLIGATVMAQCLWGAFLAVCLLTMAGLSTGTRADVMIVLTPAIVLNGLSASRSIFGVRFIATPTLILDIATTLGQCAVMVALALSHAPVLWLAINLSAWYCLTSIAAILLSRKQVRITRASVGEVARLIRQALPLGVASVLASLYFTIDMTLLGWLVRPSALALYAVAVRVLTVLVTIPGFIMAAGLVGLSRHVGDTKQLSQFAGTLASWIAVTALPLGLAVAVFARPVIVVLFGSGYLPAVPVLRVLMLAAILTLFSNVFGIILVAKGIVRPQIVFNLLSLAVNVTGNVLLAPRYGVIASAWLTVTSEAIVLSYAFVTLRRRLNWSDLVRPVWRPASAAAIAAGDGAIFGGAGLLAIASGGGVFVLAMTLLRGWPEILVTSLRAQRPGRRTSV
jgi:O-antigen/teichoic acid export membrane protein